jgi:predicted glycosyltransferase
VNCPEKDFAGLVKLAGDGVVVERSRPDFPALLANCELSISQGGYNTLMETMQAGARAVVVPFAEGGESEQTLRARLLAERGLLEVVEALSPGALAAAVERALGRPRPALGASLEGARNSAALVREWLRA